VEGVASDGVLKRVHEEAEQKVQARQLAGRACTERDGRS
jgi:hypothetical protein